MRGSEAIRGLADARLSVGTVVLLCNRQWPVLSRKEIRFGPTAGQEMVQPMDKRNNGSRRGNKCSLICYEILSISSGLCVRMGPTLDKGRLLRVHLFFHCLLHSFKITCTLLITIRFCAARSFPAPEQWNSDTRTRRWSCSAPHYPTLLSSLLSHRIPPVFETGNDRETEHHLVCDETEVSAIASLHSRRRNNGYA